MIRIFDILFSLSALICFSPFGFIIAAVLKFTGEGEIFYSQDRVGKDGKIFHLLKFATMLKKSPSIGTGDITLSNDPRVLKFGKFLRKTKLNEIPQLINVLKGDMSLVGPRPLTPKNFSYYSEDIRKEIVKITPGLTGVGSIYFRDEESIIAKSSKTYLDCYKEDIAPYKGKLELWYIKNRSLILYFKLIFCTVLVVLFKENKIYEKIIKPLGDQ